MTTRLTTLAQVKQALLDDAEAALSPRIWIATWPQAPVTFKFSDGLTLPLDIRAAAALVSILRTAGWYVDRPHPNPRSLS